MERTELTSLADFDPSHDLWGHFQGCAGAAVTSPVTVSPSSGVRELKAEQSPPAGSSRREPVPVRSTFFPPQ